MRFKIVSSEKPIQHLAIRTFTGAVLSVQSHADALVLRRGGSFALWIGAAYEIPPELDPEVRLQTLWVPLDDVEVAWGSPEGCRTMELIGLAAVLATSTLKRGGNVLISCHLGLNRSSVVAAVTLRMLGATPKQALDLIRATRGAFALSNRSFEQLVLHGERPRKRCNR